MKLKALLGITLTLSMVLALFAVTPISATQGPPIVIGIICDKGLTEGLALWRGAEMARDEANAWEHGTGAGSGVFNATGADDYRKIELLYIDEHAYPLRPDLGVAELVGALPMVDFLIGGFRSECAFPMREAAMDYAAAHGGPIWIVSGSATTRLIDCGDGSCGACVLDNYPRYKYMFRVTPMNDSWLVFSILGFVREYLLGQMPLPDSYGPPYNDTYSTPAKLACMYGSPVPTYLVIENLVWADTMVVLLSGAYYGVYQFDYPPPPDNDAVLGNHSVVVGLGRPAWDEENFGTLLDAIDTSGAKLVLHIFSAIGGGSFSKQFGERGIDAVLMGINVEAQSQYFWERTGGACAYEAFLASVGTRTPVIPGLTDIFWDDYYAEYTDYPVYTSFGAHDGLLSLCEILENVNTLDNDVIIPTLEQNVRDGLLGKFKFTGPHPGPGYQYAGVINNLNPTRAGGLHDVFSNSKGTTWDGVNPRPQTPQWQYGSQEIICPRNMPYSKKFLIPPDMWTTAGGYSLAETDWSGVSPNPLTPYYFPDGDVDMDDVSDTALYWLGAPPWPALEADMNGDQVIDIFDLSKIGKDFGKSVA